MMLAAFEAGDIADICRAIEDATRLHNISELARRSGIVRTSLYRAFAGGKAHPNFSTVLSVLHAMGFQLHVTCARTLRRGRRMTKAQASAPLLHRVNERNGSLGLVTGCLPCPGERISWS
ncbi:putative addiction module antidote protein [Bradyrhizobium sp. CSA207]|nr:putative addiction module antidote protein [Bradyrhizobium sp. CSA207]